MTIGNLLAGSPVSQTSNQIPIGCFRYVTAPQSDVAAANAILILNTVGGSDRARRDSNIYSSTRWLSSKPRTDMSSDNQDTETQMDENQVGIRLGLHRWDETRHYLQSLTVSVNLIHYNVIIYALIPYHKNDFLLLTDSLNRHSLILFYLIAKLSPAWVEKGDSRTFRKHEPPFDWLVSSDVMKITAFDWYIMSVFSFATPTLTWWCQLGCMLWTKLTAAPNFHIFPEKSSHTIKAIVEKNDSDILISLLMFNLLVCCCLLIVLLC